MPCRVCVCVVIDVQNGAFVSFLFIFGSLLFWSVMIAQYKNMSMNKLLWNATRLIPSSSSSRYAHHCPVIPSSSSSSSSPPPPPPLSSSYLCYLLLVFFQLLLLLLLEILWPCIFNRACVRACVCVCDVRVCVYKIWSILAPHTNRVNGKYHSNQHIKCVFLAELQREFAPTTTTTTPTAAIVNKAANNTPVYI